MIAKAVCRKPIKDRALLFDNLIDTICNDSCMQRQLRHCYAAPLSVSLQSTIN